jgi:hypothetical protein
MKRCPSDNKAFPNDRRFCSACGAVLVEEFEAVTLMMPKIKTKKAVFIEMIDDFTFKLSIRDQAYKLSIDEVRILAAEINANRRERAAVIKSKGRLNFAEKNDNRSPNC